MSTRRAIVAALVHGDEGLLPGRAVVIDGDRIVDVLRRELLPPEVPVDDWGDVAIVPGTVNAHGHAFQSLFKGFADDRDFGSWCNDVMYPFADRLGPDEIHLGALFAFAEAALAGVTTTVDFFYLHDEGNDNAEQVIRAAKQVGIRLVLARTFYEPDAPTAAPARFRERPEEAAERLLALAAEHRDDPLVHIQPAPHSLRAAGLETVRRALAVAEQLDVPCHLHVHEDPAARAELERRLGATPIRALAAAGLITPRLLVVHGMWLEEDELDLIAAGGASVVHCPATCMAFGDPITPTVAMMDRGIDVALGFDGGCGNNRQSIFDEMRMASLAAKQLALDPRAMGVRRAFEMGTAAGADALGIAAGRIEPGRFADLVALDLCDLSLQPRATAEYQIVHSMQSTAVRRVMTGGVVTVDDGRLTGVDAADLVARLRELTDQWAMPPRAGATR